MKIAIIGYGKMGHIIEEVARKRGHEIVCTIDQGEEVKFDSEAFRDADVAIEFSVPTAAVGNIRNAFGAGVPVVCGTTGWIADLPEVENWALAGKNRLVYGSNFSIGVHLFWQVNRYMTSLMDKFGEYRPELTETHHIHKLDHPSGTAITTAEQTVGASSRLTKWEESETPVGHDVLNVRYRRQDEVPGIHTMEWLGPDDKLTLTHSAHSRRGFAAGAVMAAEWIVNREPGVYNVNDMMADMMGK